MADCGCKDSHEKIVAIAESINHAVDRLVRASAAPLEKYVQTIPRQSVVTIGQGATTAVVSLTPTPGTIWKVGRISMHVSTGTAVLDVLVGPKGVTDNAYRRDHSAAASDNVSDQSTPIYVPAGDHLVLSWSQASAGAVCQAALQIEVHRMGIPQGAAS